MQVLFYLHSETYCLLCKVKVGFTLILSVQFVSKSEVQRKLCSYVKGRGILKCFVSFKQQRWESTQLLQRLSGLVQKTMDTKNDTKL